MSIGVPDELRGVSSLSDLPEFSDLILSDQRMYVKGIHGHQDLVPLPESFRSEADRLVQRCSNQSRNHQEDQPDLLLHYNDQRFRVSVGQSKSDDRFFVLRQSPDFVPDLLDDDFIGMRKPLAQALVSTALRPGLIVIAGPTDSGKTTTASSIVKTRLRLHGGLAITIEDPAELPLEGEYQKGVCYQLEYKGSFQALLKKTMRMNPDIIFLGEIRDREAASQAIQASIDGHLVITTVHANDVTSALSRLLMFAGEDSVDQYRGDLSKGLSGVIHQEFKQAPSGRRLVTEPLLFNEMESEDAMRARLNEGRIQKLKENARRQETLIAEKTHGASE